MSSEEFMARYGEIYEHSPWVAERAAALVDDKADADTVARAMRECVTNASRDEQLALICAHPDLAGKAAIAGEISAASVGEQASAGLDRCAPRELERLDKLTREYRQRFGFPFVMAVRGRSAGEILDAMQARLGNGYDDEFDTALAEIHKIAHLRLTAMGAD